ncbi:hypothetical protein VKT23_006869 [Stygiomarasmius scandens]|uniref:F-box domain-containing protein n=1 Tax=Marasmiellus scandens TaxID=2682957 RepID=A0ABR1JLX5_9AGAR
MVQPQLPLELWLYIVQFIPEAVLRRQLLGVNRFFYEISMDLRYRQVELQTLKPATSKVISRLSDPHVGKRVRSLTVSPDFRFYGQTRPVSLLNRITSALYYTFRLQPVFRPEEEATKALINILPGLTNVTTFTIDSHSWGPHSGPDLPDFLQTAWSSFGSNLKKLSLRGHASSFHTIIQSKPSFPLLEELFLELIDNPLNPDRVCETKLMVTDVAPFINTLASQLITLTIWSWGTSDLSDFFLKLEEFPLLASFNLQTAFPKTFTIDPSGLARFLQKHCPTLERFVLRLNTAPSALQTLSEQTLGHWMKDCFAPVTFNRLRELHMYPTFQSEGMGALVLCIQRSQSTLTNLVVRDRYLDLGEVEMIVTSLSAGLQFLRLNVKSLTPELLDVVSGLSGLKSLSLFIGNVSSDFIGDMETRLYEHWKLENIGVWLSGSWLDGKVMRSISLSIPSLTSFWGTGTLDLEGYNELQ